MEIFKTSVGSWIYPEPSLLRIGGVPLFTGFMYAAIGSYIARCWRLFDFRFTRPPAAVGAVAAGGSASTSISSPTTTCGRALALFAPTRCCSGAAGCISRSGACTGACRCCWASRWSRSSSGSPRTSAPSPRPGSTPPAARLGAGALRQARRLVPADDHQLRAGGPAEIGRRNTRAGPAKEKRRPKPPIGLRRLPIRTTRCAPWIEPSPRTSSGHPGRLAGPLLGVGAVSRL